MQDRPTSRELLDSVAQFLDSELIPTLNDPRLKFRARVAANVLTIVSREVELSDAQLRAERERLVTLLNESALTDDVRGDVERMTRALARRIRAGDADEGTFHDAVFAHVEQTVIEKLQIANPRYLKRVCRGDLRR